MICSAVSSNLATFCLKYRQWEEEKKMSWTNVSPQMGESDIVSE